jgi:hypothetical protein
MNMEMYLRIYIIELNDLPKNAMHIVDTLYET